MQVLAHHLNLVGDRKTVIAKICQTKYTGSMTTMNISLPETLKSFVDEQVAERGYGTSSEYVRELIRKDQDRQSLRGLLLAGASSRPGKAADGDYFNALRKRVKKSGSV
jgi:antitoxin ParD1/3/4